MSTISEYERRIEQQFDHYCKVVLKNGARNMYKKTKPSKEKQVSFEGLKQDELDQLSVFDEYSLDHISFVLFDYPVQVEDMLIAQAIKSLSKKQQDIILLSFYHDLKNVEIASLMNLAESTVHYHKENALKEIKQFLEGDVGEEI